MTEQEELLFLRSENANLRSENQIFRETISVLTKEVSILGEKTSFLLGVIEKQGIKKDSHNSSLPPSSDIGRKNKSLRPPSVLKIGGQVGHKGTTLEQTPNPDRIIELKSDFCQVCGQSLEGSLYTLVSRRQVVDIPPILPIYEEYRQYSCNCGKCGHVQKATYPAGVTAPIQYGSGVLTLVSYLSVYQYLPYRRLSQLFAAVFGLPLSQGSLDNLLTKASQKAQGVYEQIRQNISNSTVVGSDETSAKVNGNKWWIWVWQNVQNTFIVASQNRGFATIETYFEAGFAQATLISDRWAAQLKAIALNHQLCLAHLLRDTIFLIESEKNEQKAFANGFSTLLKDALDLRKELEKTGKPADEKHPKATLLQKQLNQLLALTIDNQKYPLTATFQLSIIKNRNYLFPFLYNLDIPPDNNGSERAIRNIKVKQKISGQFKSGQNTFCVLRSVIDTLIKRKLNVFSSLFQIMNLVPE